MNKIELAMQAFKVFIDGNAVKVAALGGAKQSQNKKNLIQNEKERTSVQ